MLQAFTLSLETAWETGNSLWLSFLIAFIVSMFTGLSYIELISMYPLSEAEYIYVKHSLGSSLVAFSIGWIEIFADIITASTVSIGFAKYLVGLLAVTQFLWLLAQLMYNH